MESQRNPAVKWGLIFGGLLILVGLINYGIQYATGALDVAATPASVRRINVGGSLAQSCVIFLIEAALLFLAGMMTARENGRVGSGSIAGLIAGALYGVVAAIAGVITINLRSAALTQSINAANAQTVLVVVSVFVVVLVLVFEIGIGAGIGALGALVGRSQYERTHPAQPMIGSLYTPMTPPAGYPPAGYPPATGYPPTGYPPAGYPPATGYPPAGYPPTENPPATGYPPSGYPPTPGSYPPPQSTEYPPQTPPQTPQQQ